MNHSDSHPKLAYYQDEFLSEMRTLGDPQADALIETLFSSSEGAKGVRQAMKSIVSNKNLYQSDLPEPLATFYRQEAVLPQWADRNTMLRGASFFARHAQQIMSMLGTLSLPYCYAGANGAQVLFLSRRIYDDTPRRLLETGQFVLDVSLRDAFDDGRGFASILNVRLMHAAIRYHIRKSGEWNEAWGHPINQEDMAGTIEAFSFVCIRGLRKSGIIVSYDDASAFQHLWNVVGKLMGVRDELLPDTGLEASRLDACIRERQFRSSEAGYALTTALLNTLKKSSIKGLPHDFIPSYTRFLLGDDVADMLDVPKISEGSQFPLTLMQWRNLLTSMFASNRDHNLNILRNQIAQGQINELVRFSIPMSI